MNVYEVKESQNGKLVFDLTLAYNHELPNLEGKKTLYHIDLAYLWGKPRHSFTCRDPGCGHTSPLVLHVLLGSHVRIL